MRRLSSERLDNLTATTLIGTTVDMIKFSPLISTIKWDSVRVMLVTF